MRGASWACRQTVRRLAPPAVKALKALFKLSLLKLRVMRRGGGICRRCLFRHGQLDRTRSPASAVTAI